MIYYVSKTSKIVLYNTPPPSSPPPTPLCTFVVTNLENKLEQYKFGLPTLLISGEQEIYNQTKSEIDSVTKKY